MGTFNLPPSYRGRPGRLDPGFRRGKKTWAFRIHHANPQSGRNPLSGYISIDLFSEEFHAGSVDQPSREVAPKRSPRCSTARRHMARELALDICTAG